MSTPTAEGALDAASGSFMETKFPEETTPTFLTVARQFIGDVDFANDEDADTKLESVLEAIWKAGVAYGKAYK